MEHELTDLFPKKETVYNAVILLREIRNSQPIEQKALSEKLFGYNKAAEMTCSRILDKLERHNYIKREAQGQHHKNMVMLI
jgi:uncharacterized membrane protein